MQSSKNRPSPSIKRLSRSCLPTGYLLAALALACPSPCQAVVVITGPFVPGSGVWNTIPNGDFESGDETGWTDQYPPEVGLFRVSSDLAHSGTYAAKSIPQSILGGFASESGPLTIDAGQEYVISAFIHTANLASSGNRAWIDLNDYSQADVDVAAANGISEWQFVYHQFTAPSSQVRVRIAEDGILDPAKVVYFDSVALTPANSFVPPTLVPEPDTFSISIALSLLGFIGCKKVLNRIR